MFSSIQTPGAHLENQYQGSNLKFLKEIIPKHKVDRVRCESHAHCQLDFKQNGKNVNNNRTRTEYINLNNDTGWDKIDIGLLAGLVAR